MSQKTLSGAADGSAPRPVVKPARPDAQIGTRAPGRIVKLMVGQGHGFIRLVTDREIYFHRADLAESNAFNRFQVGDRVQFELFEDPVSGPRALRVTWLARAR